MSLATEMLDMLSQISKPFNHLAIKEQTVTCFGINVLPTVTLEHSFKMSTNVHNALSLCPFQE